LATLSTTKRRAIRSDDVFFPAMSLLMLAIVVAGFSQSYFFAGMVFAKLPNALVHVHGFLLVTWIFLMVAQNALVATHHVRWHMRLGVLGFILPPLMIILGEFTLVDSIRRAQVPVPPEIILVGDTEELVIFVILTAWAMAVRRNPVAHKRLMLLGTIALLGPAIDRLHILDSIMVTIAINLAIPVLLVAYDLLSLRRVQRATIIGYAMIAAAILTLLPVSQLPIFHQAVAIIRGTSAAK
jgi:hypothetical protein